MQCTYRSAVFYKQVYEFITLPAYYVCNLSLARCHCCCRPFSDQNFPKKWKIWRNMSRICRSRWARTRWEWTRWCTSWKRSSATKVNCRSPRDPSANSENEMCRRFNQSNLLLCKIIIKWSLRMLNQMSVNNGFICHGLLLPTRFYWLHKWSKLLLLITIALYPNKQILLTMSDHESKLL